MLTYQLHCLKNDASIVTYYIKNCNTKLFIDLSLHEKSEVDDKVEVLMVCDDVKISNQHQKIIFEVVNNLIAEPMEKTKLCILVNVIDYDLHCFETILNCLCICLLESGIKIYDIFSAFYNENMNLVYSTNQNSVLNCFWTGTTDYKEDLNTAIQKCIESAEEIKEYIINKYT